MSVKPVSSSSEPNLLAARRLATVVVSLIAAIVCALSASSARAALTITEFTASTASNVAGAHPDATAALAFQTTFDSARGPISAGGTLRAVTVKLPPGLVGVAQNVPQCSVTTFTTLGCSPATQIGTGSVTVTAPAPHGGPPNTFRIQIYNLASAPNQALMVGLQLDSFGAEGQTLVTATAHADDNYAVTLSIAEIPLTKGSIVLSSSLTLWGVPAAPSHDPQRSCWQFGLHGETNGWEIGPAFFGWPNCAESVTRPPLLPFVENPTDCAAAPLTTLLVNTYEEPQVFTTGTFTAPTPTNCQTVPFAPSLSVTPDGEAAGAPTGVGAELAVPQNEDPAGQGSSEVKQVAVTLPPGMVISPSAAANGLEGCSDEQLGAGSDAPATCPAASQVGTVEVLTRLLSGPLTGKIYLGTPLNNDAAAGEMFRIFLELKGFGQDVKLKGSVIPNPATGQLTATFANLPEVPFNAVKLHFNGGPNATLVNPSSCGQNTTTTQITPYSDPTVPATPSSTFTTSYDGAGAPCPASLPFAPSASISTASSQAGALSPVSVSFTRGDGQQALGQLTAHLPPGLLGYVSKIALCDAADAAAGTCPPESRIGTVNATAGAGPDPLTVPGTVYLARGAGGYPFALSVVVPAVAGPYDLGNVTVVVNLQVNDDGSLTAISNPLPSILDGIPLDVRGFTLTIDRPGFTVNPTNCSPLSMGGTATALSGTLASISAPFQVSGCGSLPFKPSFTVSTQGSTSRTNGASLTARVSQRPGEANIHSVKVELPKALPSRLTTLQKACPERVFFSNPAACGRGSLVGTATAWTPLLSKPLQGPAYFVSHGGAKFPELIIVLQGEGVTIELPGETFISKAGITSSTFNAVPDVPVSGFQLTLPEGPYSALADIGNPCTQKLQMPTTITGQNGVQVKQATRIGVTGCAKPKPAVTVVKTKAKTSSLTVTLETTVAGTVKLNGPGLDTKTKKNVKAGTSQIEVSLTKAGQALRARHEKLELRATLTVGKVAVAKTTRVKL
ncbi:MAG TPA: hypothetical protein VII53_02320 [Solirubrobacteraceae bacterium]